MAQQVSNTSPLAKLSETDLDLADPSQDIRGRKVLDSEGGEIGHVSALFVDEAERKVRMLEIRAGGLLGIGEQHFLLPVDAVTSVDKHDVHVNETHERIVHSPAYDPQLVEFPERSYWEPYYGYYGLSPYWGTGYIYPGVPFAEDEGKRVVRP
jgi:sporulation protein YlmC with PRC-barrel domain